MKTKEKDMTQTQTEYMRAWRAANPEKSKQHSRADYEKNKENPTLNQFHSNYKNNPKSTPLKSLINADWLVTT